MRISSSVLSSSFLPSPPPTGEYRSAREDHPQSRDRINDNGEGEIFIRTARKSVGWKQLRNSKRRILDPGTWKSLEIGYSRILHLLNPDNKIVYESYTYHFYPPSFIDDPQRYLSGYLSSEIFNITIFQFSLRSQLEIPRNSKRSKSCSTRVPIGRNGEDASPSPLIPRCYRKARLTAAFHRDSLI